MTTSASSPLSPKEQAGRADGSAAGDATLRTSVDLHTLASPSFAAALPTLKGPAPSETKALQLECGTALGDFLLLRLLGKGGFASVFLARQVSLGRLVALKVGPNRGDEARTLASLEHDHIVQVFSETVDKNRDLRLLCMQYVPGATLQDVMAALPPDRRVRTGQDFLAALDAVSKHPDEFRPAALQERAALAEDDFTEAVCRLGARLAEALAFAHRQGILHRDLKPANILINVYGRPFLADFNLARRADPNERQEELFGGTLGVMSPEHLDAFVSRDPAALDAVDERSDLYSLGMSLYEFLVGRHPFPLPPDQAMVRDVLLKRLADERRENPPKPSPLDPALPCHTESTLVRCLAPEPADRPPDATTLALELEQCRRFRAALRVLPALPRGTHWMSHRPFLALLALAIFPNLFGTLVNVAYNAIHIVDHLTPTQQTAFEALVVGYNGLAYPILVGLTCWFLWRVRQGWLQILNGEPLEPKPLAKLRRDAQFLVAWSMLGTSLGWLPGGVVFPLVIHWAEPLSRAEFGHFLVSFTLSGLIAVTYCYLGSTWIVLRLLYPVLWSQPTVQGPRLADELRRHPPRLGLFQCLAGIIPLAGAILMVLSGPETYGDIWFRLLVCGLIVLGILGFAVAVRIAQSLQQTLAVYART